MFDDHSPIGRIIHFLARYTALLGGAVLTGVIVLITLSIVGRALIWAGLRPIRGDYELASIGVAFVVFAFLPWTHLMRGHAVVTLVTDNFSKRVNAWILVLTDAAILVAAAFLTWTLYQGMLEKFAYGETTLLLRIPLGWAYASALVGCVVFVIVALFVFCRSLSNAVSGRIEASRGGAEI